MNGTDKLYWKEAVMGVILGSSLYLSYRFMNPVPFLLVFCSGVLVYYFLERQGINGSVGSEALVKDFSFDDIGGQQSAKRELIEALDFISQNDEASALGIRPLKGILLTGPPGTGKTLMAKAAAAYTNMEFVSCSGSDFIEVYAGVGASRVRGLFKKAREQAKKNRRQGAILFVDEIDVLGAKRGGNHSHMEYEQTLNALLVEMDGLKSDDPIRVLVMGATNRPDLLDAALLRPGRFDRQVQVELPDIEGRVQILQIHTRGKPLKDDVNLQDIAKESFGFSGAQLESATNEAAIFALRDKMTQITRRHFQDAIEKVLMGENGDRTPSREEIQRVSVHEAGHALISEYTRPNSVARLTVTPRGKALGYLRQVPAKDTYLETKEELLNGIRVALAGMLAEEALLGQGSTGARQDLAQATGLARHLLASGLSSLGAVDLNEVPEVQRYREIKHILEQETNWVKGKMSEYSSALKELSTILLERETMSGDEVREILGRSIAKAS